MSVTTWLPSCLQGTDWSIGTSSVDKFGADYRFTSTAASNTRTSTYAPNVLTAGNYDVYEWHTAGGNRSTAAPWTISTPSTNVTVAVDQSSLGGQWIKLVSGAYFAAGSSATVSLRNGTGESLLTVIADGIRLAYSTNRQDSAPAITAQPVSTNKNFGDNAILNVTATGTAPLTYQWQKNGADLSNTGNITGATTPHLTISGVTVADVASYTVVVSNWVSTLTSSAATLTVNDPAITSQPTGTTVECGANGNLTVAAIGTGLTYQWYTPDANGTAVSGQTTATLTAVAHGTTAYVCVVSASTGGTATSSSATVTAHDTIVPSITVNSGPSTGLSRQLVFRSGSNSQ